MKQKQGKKRAHKKKSKYHNSKQNNSGMICIAGITCILLVVMSIQIYSLYNKNRLYIEKEEQLQSQLKEEQQRENEILDYQKQINSDEYIEKIAKFKLGLIYPHEIVYKEKEN